MLEIKGYITNLGKYNEGELIGKWISFPITNEELQEVYKEIGINDQYEEYFFTDWDCEIELGFGEYVSISKVNETAELLENWGDNETLLAACEVWNLSYVLENDENDYILHSNVNDDYDLGYYYAIECDCIDFDSNSVLERYFDFESYGRDIRIDSQGDFTSYGYIEYIG